MFTRRPFAGLACASCEKDVFNMNGRKADFIPWGKLPYRDPSERIARVSNNPDNIGWKGFFKDALLSKPRNAFPI